MFNCQGRLFTFGCSFTQYHWPTWADILGRKFEYYENWGKVGAGNQYIFNALIECHLRNQFTKDDTVIIMWTSYNREDRYINNMWQTPGGLSNQNFYDESFISKYYDHRGSLIRDFISIKAAIDLLDFWGVNYRLLSMVPFNNNSLYQIDADLLTLFNSVIKSIKISAYEILYNNSWWLPKFRSDFSSTVNKEQHMNLLENQFNQSSGTDWPSFSDFLADNIDNKFRSEIEEFGLFQIRDHAIRVDNHPIPTEHLSYLNTVLPEFKISLETEEWINNYIMFDKFNTHRPTNRL